MYHLAASTLGNWEWLLQHFVALCEEYSFRYYKRHRSEDILPYLLEYRSVLKPGLLTSFVNCTKSEAMQVDFRHLEDPCEAYKNYLLANWSYDKLPPKWIHRKPPVWYSE